MYRFRKHPRGLNLIEAMILLLVVSIVAVATGVGLQAVAKVPQITDDIMAVNNVLTNVTEQVRGNVIASWPTTTYSTGLIVNGTSYSPSVTINNTAYNYGTPATYTSVTNSLSINSKTYQLSLAIDKADPAGGTSYQNDYYRIIVCVTPYIGGTLTTARAKTMVTYVTQP
jgi:type II secretory pathway pseudopilin PulG